MILGSLTGGPLAVMLIKRYKLKADPQDGAPQAGGSEEKTALDTGKLLKHYLYDNDYRRPAASRFICF